MNKYCDYKNLKLGKIAPRDVTQEDIDSEINRIISQSISYQEVEEESKLGDTVNIDFEGFIDGVAFEGGKGENYDLELGSNSFIPGFEDQLVGYKKDAEVDVNVTFPEDYHAENLKGKPAIFKCKIHSVKQKITPEFNDQFAKENHFESKEHFISAIKSHLLEVNSTEATNQYITKICDYLAENSQLDIEEDVIENRLTEIINYYEQSIAQYGATLEAYLKMSNMDISAFKEKLKPEAIKSIKIDLVYNYILEQENLFVTDEEVNSQFEYIRNYYKLSDEQFAKFQSERFEELKAECQRQKISQFLVLNND